MDSCKSHVLNESANCEKQKFSKAKLRRLRRLRTINRLSDINKSSSEAVSYNKFEKQSSSKAVNYNKFEEHCDCDKRVIICNSENLEQQIKIDNYKMSSADNIVKVEKTREEIMAERAAKKLAKQNAKSKTSKVENQSNNPVDEVMNKLKNVNLKVAAENLNEKCREEIKAECEAKKLAKQQTKNKVESGEVKQIEPSKSKAIENHIIVNKTEGTLKSVLSKDEIVSLNMVAGNPNEKSREEIKAEREAKKLAKQQSKNKKTESGEGKQIEMNMENHIALNKTGGIVKPVLSKDEVDKAVLKNQNIEVQQEKLEKSKAELRAERRAKQEAQRAAKSAGVTEKPAVNATENKTNKTPILEAEKISKPILKKKIVSSPQIQHKVKLFSHLYTESNINSNTSGIHPAIVRLGEQYREGVIAGSNARCIAFLNALKIVINDYITPPQREFKRELESSLKPYVDYLHRCRPVSVSMTNALRFVKRQISQLPIHITDVDAKNKLVVAIDTYYKEQICTAADAISGFVQNKIVNGDVILTFSCSSLIQQILEDVSSKMIDFRVIVVDGRPSLEGKEMLRRLIKHGIKCSYVLINAASFIMGEVTKVLLGAHALLANGYVMSRVGTAQIAMIAHSFNVPVLVCCETHKFIERVQTDSFVYNEIGNPECLVSSSKPGPLCGWLNLPTLSPLNLRYDVTPPELVTAVVTELAILPCTSVPVILRIKPAEIAY